MFGTGRINPNSPGSGEGERLGSTAQLRMERIDKNSAPRPGKMLTQLLLQDVFGIAKPQEAGLAADCAGLARGQGRDLQTSSCVPFLPSLNPREAAALPLGDFRRLQPCSARTWLLAVRKYPVHDSSNRSNLLPPKNPARSRQ